MSIFALSQKIERLEGLSKQNRFFIGDYRCNCSQFQSLEEMQSEIKIHREKGLRIFVARDISVDESGKPFVNFKDGLLVPDGFRI